MMGALEATDSMLLFGISTAYIFTVMQDQFRLMTRPLIEQEILMFRRTVAVGAVPSSRQRATAAEPPHEVLRDLDQKRLTTAAAAQLLGLGRRQVFRLSILRSAIG